MKRKHAMGVTSNDMEAAQRYTLTAFADEISPDLDVQVSTLARLNVSGLDLRSVGGVNVLDLTIDDLQRIHDKCAENGLAVQAIGSPVNKVPFDPMNESREFERLGRAIRAANRVNVKRIRIFSPMVADPTDVDAGHRVMAWMNAQRQLAKDEGVLLIHENDDRYWGAHPDNAKRMLEELAGPNLKFAYDFANTVLQGYRTMRDWFPWLMPYIDTLHIKDAKESDHKILPAGEGDGEMVEGIKALVAAGWVGPLTIEPHLSAAGPLGGFSGEQLFEVAVNACRKVAAESGIGFE